MKNRDNVIRGKFKSYDENTLPSISDRADYIIKRVEELRKEEATRAKERVEWKKNQN